MARRHGQRAEENRAAPTKDAIGEKAAENRGEINCGGVSAEDRGCERLSVEPAVEWEAAESVEDCDAFDAAGEEKILHHVKNEQRLHAVVGEAFPRFREGEEPKAARMPEKAGCVFLAGQRRSVIGFGGSGHEASRLANRNESGK